MFEAAFNNPSIKQVSLGEATANAAFGNFAFGLYYNPKCVVNAVTLKSEEAHGHAVGFAVGYKNAIEENVANIGTHNTFESIMSFSTSMQKNFMYYILAPTVTPKQE